MIKHNYTELIIYSKTVVPDILNQILGIRCDSSHVIGDMRKGTIIREKANAWILYSRLLERAPITDHISDLLARVIPIKDRIQKFSRESDITVAFNCIIKAHHKPALFFTKEHTQLLCELGAEIDIDLL